MNLLMKHRKGYKLTSKIESCCRSMISLEVTYLLIRWCPVFRWRELGPGPHAERVNLSLGAKRKAGSSDTVTAKVSKLKVGAE